MPSGLVVVALAFVASGFAGLVHEVSWIRRGALLFGSTTQALSTVLGVFFFGLGVGAELGGRLSRRLQRPLLGFAVAEFVVALSALATLPLFELASAAFRPFYDAGLAWPAWIVGARLLITVMLLLVPTVAMGMSLPLLTRVFVARRDEAGARVGWLYGLNTLGAAAGAAAAGWYLLPAVGIRGSIALAASINLAVAIVAAVGARAVAPVPPSTPRTRSATSSAAVALLVVASGFCALGFQVVWARFATMFVTNTVTTYTLVIVLVLTGLVAGSIAAALALRIFVRHGSIALLYGALQVAAALAFLYTIFLPPQWFTGAAPACLYALLLLPPTIFSGALFPLAVQLTVDDGSLAGHATGRLYAANVAGAVAGSLLCGFVLLPGFGLAATAKSLGLLGVCAGIIAAFRFSPAGLRPWVIATGVASVAAGIWIPGAADSDVPGDYLAAPGRLVDYREGISANVAVVRDDDTLQMEIDGWWQGSERPNHQAIAVHIPMVLHGAAAEVLIVGAGAGQAPAAAVAHDSLIALDVVDIEPAVFAMIRRHFSHEWMNDARVRLVRDDGRNFIRHTRKRFDVIAVEAGQLHRPGVAAFYTLDFYREAHAALAPGGMLSQFVPLPFLTEAQLVDVIATFVAVFPEAMLWYNTEELLLLGCRGSWTGCLAHALKPLETDTRVYEQLQFSHWGGPRQWLTDKDAFAAGFLAGPATLAALSADGRLSRDDRPQLEYELASPQASSSVPDKVQWLRRHLEPVSTITNLLPGLDPERVAEIRRSNVSDLVAADLLRTARELSGGLESKEPLLRAAVAANDLNVDAQRLLGDALAARGELTEARHATERALAIDPLDVHALYTLAYIAGRERAHAEAIEVLQKLVAIEPGNARFHNDLGVALVNAGDLYGARRSFERALALDETLVGARVNLQQVESLLQ